MLFIVGPVVGLVVGWVVADIVEWAFDLKCME